MKQETPKRRRWTNCFNLHLQWRNKIRQNLIRTWMRQFWKGILFSKITKALWLSSQTTEAEQGLIKALGIHIKKKKLKKVSGRPDETFFLRQLTRKQKYCFSAFRGFIVTLTSSYTSVIHSACDQLKKKNTDAKDVFKTLSNI